MDLAVYRPLLAGRNQRVRRDPVGASGEKHGSGAEFSAAATVVRKQLVWFERSAHLPNTEEKDKFNEFMINTVLPTLPE
jgi:hypothetical protein